MCDYPYTLNPSNPIAYNNDNGCIILDNRNIDQSFVDGHILFGGGWHYNRPPGSRRIHESQPSGRYYGLEATTDPYRVKVLQLPEKMPSPSADVNVGKFYSCLMHLDENEVMVAGGKNGDSHNDFDDKTFVYRFQDNASNGEWIGTGMHLLKNFLKRKYLFRQNFLRQNCLTQRIFYGKTCIPSKKIVNQKHRDKQ